MGRRGAYVGRVVENVNVWVGDGDSAGEERVGSQAAAKDAAADADADEASSHYSEHHLYVYFTV